MANAKICDRCGNVYGKNNHQESFDENAHGTVRGVCVMFEETDKFRKNHYSDLCDECAKQLCLFLRDKGAKVEPSIKARDRRY